MNAFHMIGLTQAFWNAVRGESRRVPVERLERRVDEDDPETEPAVHDRLGLRLVQGAHRVIDVLRGLRDLRLRDDANTLAGGTHSAGSSDSSRR